MSLRIGESETGARLAYTAGGMVLSTAEGTRRRVPAGACRVDRQSAALDVCTVPWSESGMNYSALLSGEELRTYLVGCIVQYA